MGSVCWKVLTRRKVLDPDTTHETPLARVLNTFDLTALGVGSTLGVGVYVLAGQVAKNTAGPAVILSFLIAAIASVFAGLCYAEFGARTPRAGSAYIYSYLSVGEFVAFVIGWNLILEYIIGSASVAKGISSYIDNLVNGTLSRTFEEIAPLDLPYLSKYFDFLAFSMSVALAIALAFGMKESSLVNNVFTTINIGVVLFVIIAGSFNAHLSNWFINPDDVKNVTNGTHLGEGGFLPFGFGGVIRGAATCFYGFVGFDCIATTGEEVKNPKKAIPIAIILSLFIIFLAYFGTSTVITLMVPYYEQNPTAPIPYAFQSVHWNTAALIVTIGALFGLYASLFGAMFPLPRILYAMASDGLIFKWMGAVSERFKTPVAGTLLTGIFTGTMAAIFQLESLVNMMSIGTLLAYTIVAASVLLLRYSVDEKSYAPISNSSDSEEIEGYSQNYENSVEDETPIDVEEIGILKKIFNINKTEIPNKTTETIVSINICIYCILCFLLGLCALFLSNGIMNKEVLPIVTVSVIIFLLVLTLWSIVTQPISRKELSFQVPWVPLIPALSILFNIYLMMMLDIATWVRFVVWMIVGCLIFYMTRRKKIVKGIHNNSFYDENLVYTNNSDTFSNQETVVATGSVKKTPTLQIFCQYPNDCDALSTSPSKVIETLDLVLDSFVTSPASLSVDAADDVFLHMSSASALKGNFSNELEKISPNDSDSLHSIQSQNKTDTNPKDEELTQEPTNGEDNLVDVDETAHASTETKPKDVLTQIYKEEDNPVDTDEAVHTSIETNSKDELTLKSSEEDNNDNDETAHAYTESNPKDELTQKFSKDSDKAAHTSTETNPKDEENNFVDSDSLTGSERSYLTASSSISVDRKMTPPTPFSPPLPPPPPPISNFNKFKQTPTTFNSLNSVKLRHVTASLENNKAPFQYQRSKSMNANVENKFKQVQSEQNTNTLPKISKEAINSVKLRHIIRPSLSLDVKYEDEKPDSIKFGTSEFEQFKATLNEKLKDNGKVQRTPTFVGAKGKPMKVVKIDRENINEDPIDLKKARATIEAQVVSKLNSFKNVT